ncbi:hypothetical protein X474_18315 [Dethiosulfatarculus sandiegensis]|uniref:Uncharacterized protein n=1 Tax=Dethiosulfatarculus sandiegensis TaxID=1429043 RepID=A0A0D2J313_9BACT|nr:hypothetical protein X474_18315 [Dethiosulfatarculus sandiegensis]
MLFENLFPARPFLEKPGLQIKRRLGSTPLKNTSLSQQNGARF